MNSLRQWIVSQVECNGRHDWACFTYTHEGKNVRWQHRGFGMSNQHECTKCGVMCPFGQAEKEGKKVIQRIISRLPRHEISA